MFYKEKSIAQMRLLGALSLVLTLCIIYFVQNTLVIMIILLPLWFIIFRPSKSEIIMFAIATLSIVGQNYSVLKKGGFTFTHQDFFLMPYYEPFMWGFYYLFLKRFIGEPPGAVRLSAKAVFGLALTVLSFSLFSETKMLLLISTIVSTLVLIVLFHQRHDVYYAAAALGLGFLVELFGVWTGQWHYPDPDFLGIPYWFATMWVSMGVLGRRFLIPLSEKLGTRKKWGRG